MRAQGYSLLEAVFMLALIATLASIGAPQLLAGLDDGRAAAAARYVVGRLQRARTEAVNRSANVALQFTAVDGGFMFAVYADGNGDGVRSRDISALIDVRVGTNERLSDSFAGVDFGVLAGLPPVDSGSTAPGTDPIKLGSSSLLSFSPLGTSTSGSLYILGHGGAQYVVRIVGETGRTHVLRFDTRTRQWKPV